MCPPKWNGPDGGETPSSPHKPTKNHLVLKMNTTQILWGRGGFAQNFPLLASLIKRGIVWLAVRELIPAPWATWLINVLGLRGA